MASRQDCMKCVLVPYNPRESAVDPYMLEAVKHCVQLMGRKNYNDVKAVDSETFTHTSTKGKTKIFKCYGYGFEAYRPHFREPIKKLHKVRGFYILELPEE